MTARQTIENLWDRATPVDTLLEAVEREAAHDALRDAADWAETANPDRDPDFTEGVTWLIGELRRIADAHVKGSTS